MEETDKAYLAGLINADGWIGIHKVRGIKCRRASPGYQVEVSIANTRNEFLLVFQRYYGGFISEGKRQNPKWRLLYHWRTSAGDSLKLIRDVLPYLRLKDKQAKACLALASNISRWRGWSRTPAVARVFRERLYQVCLKLNKRGVKEDEGTDRAIGELEELVSQEFSGRFPHM